MPNQQTGSTTTKAQHSTSGRAPMAGKGGEHDEATTAGLPDGESGNQLEQFATYMKGNWKVILSELVAAGVSAYLAHGAKEKAAKN